MDISGYVYIITNVINSKVYIGITKYTIKKRWNEHRCKSKKPITYLHKSIKKNGASNFTIHLLKTCYSDEQLYSSEIYFISHYKSCNRKYGYNISEGGEHSSKGRKLTDEQKKKISDFQKNRNREPHSEYTKKLLSEAKKGKSMANAVTASANNRRGKPANNIKAVVLNDVRVFSSMTQAAIATGISVCAINQQLRGRTHKTKVGIWKVYESKN